MPMAGHLVAEFASLEALFEALASDRLPRLRYGGFVCVHPDTFGGDAESEYWALCHGLACFELAVVVTRRVRTPGVEVRAYPPRGEGDGMDDVTLRAGEQQHSSTAARLPNAPAP